MQSKSIKHRIFIGIKIAVMTVIGLAIVLAASSSLMDYMGICI